MENITNKIKRIGSTALLVGVLGMSLAACGGDAATATVPAPTATIAATTGDTTSDTASMQEVKSRSPSGQSHLPMSK